MKKVRILSNAILIFSTSLLLILIADFKFSGLQRELLVNISLQSMHISLILTSVFYIIVFSKRKRIFPVLLTSIPAFIFVIAIFLKFFDFIFPGILLLTFDAYIIIWFSGILFWDLKEQN